MSLTRIALVGPTQKVSPWLMRAIGQVGAFEAICAPAAEREVEKHHARWAFADFDQMLKETEPQALVLTEPLSRRFAMARDALAAGAGVLLTAPPSPATRCKRLGTLARLAGRPLMAAAPARFSPAVLLARRLIDSGKFPAVIGLTLCSTWRGAPRNDPADNGVISLDQIFEALDLVHHLIGPMNQVFAAAQAEGAMMATAQTLDNVPLSLQFYGLAAADQVGVELEIRAADGSRLRIDRHGGLTCGNGSRVEAVHPTGLAWSDPTVELGFGGLLLEFVRQVALGHRGPGLIGPVAAVTAAAEAVLASAEKGRVMQPRPLEKRETMEEIAAKGD